MNIERIEVNNIVSLSDTIIDFTREPLKSAGLCFLTNHKNINGNMLMTMICLSLYNEAPGINSDISSILKKEDKSGLCKVTFIANDGNKYEASYKIRHNIIERALTQLTPKSHKFNIQTIQQTIDQLVELNYHQFIHTIILQQDKFLNFLKSDQQTRLEILKSIFDLDIYSSIEKNIYEEYLNAKNAYTAKCQHIDDLTKFTIEENLLNELTITLSKKQDFINQSQLELDFLNRKIKWYNQYNEANELLEQYKQKQFAIQKEFNSMYDNRTKLERFDKVLHMKELFYFIRKQELDMTLIKEKMADKNAQITECQQLADQALTNYNILKAKMEECHRTRAHFQPLIKKGYLYESIIFENKKQIQNHESKLANLLTSINQTNEKLQSLKTSCKNIEEELQKISIGIRQLEQHKIMFDHFTEINIGISKVNDNNNKIATNNAAIQDINDKLNNIKIINTENENTFKSLKAKIEATKSEICIHQNAISDTTIEKVQDNWLKCNTMIIKVEEAIEHWNKLTDIYNTIRETNEKIQKDKSNETLLEKEIVKLQQELTTKQKIYDELNLSLQLCKSEDIYELRKNLQEGIPCAVCGGTHHPYHPDADSQFNEIVENMTKNVELAKQNYDTIYNQLQNNLNQQQYIHNSIKTHESQLTIIMKQKEIAEKAWQKYADFGSSFTQCDETVNASVRQTLLTQILENAYKERNNQAEYKIVFNKHINAIIVLSSQLRELNNKISESSVKTYRITEEMNILKNQRQNLQLQNNDIKKISENIIYNLENIITINNWQNDMNDDFDSFNNKIQSYYSNWTLLIEQQRANEQQLLQNNNTISLIADQLNAIQQQRQQTIEEIEQLNQRNQDYKKELTNMFGDSSTNETYDKIQSEYTQTEIELNNAQHQYQTIKNNITLLNGEIKNLDTLLKESQVSLHQQHEALDHQIAIFNGNNSTLQYFELEQLFNDQQDWNKLRETINIKKTELSEINKLVNEANQHVISLLESSDKPDNMGIDITKQLYNKREYLETKQSAEKKEISELQSKLSAHTSIVEQINALSSERDILETEYKNWEQLYSVIGNPDDNTFLKIAHGEMFELLVASANRQLQNISTRYRLRCNTDNFTLEVIDKEMFDQTKSMTSLSTNESFIVSLSLSLGLSSLNAPNLDNLFVTSDFSYYNDQEIDFALNTYNKLQYANKCKVIFLKFP